MSTARITITTPNCIRCGRTGHLDVAPDEAAALATGEPVHQALANHPRQEREMLISGTHPKCWEALFGADPEDAPPWDLD